MRINIDNLWLFWSKNILMRISSVPFKNISFSSLFYFYLLSELKKYLLEMMKAPFNLCKFSSVKENTFYVLPWCCHLMDDLWGEKLLLHTHKKKLCNYFFKAFNLLFMRREIFRNYSCVKGMFAFFLLLSFLSLSNYLTLFNFLNVYICPRI